MKNYKVLAALAAGALSLASCGEKACIEGVLSDAPASPVVISKLDVNRIQVLDTLQTDAKGRYSYKVDIREGEPEFLYVFYHGKRVASLLLERGDRVEVTSDTMGTYSVNGSAETLKLMEVERDEADFANHFAATSARLEDMDPASAEAALVRRDLAKQYIDYYRSRVRYVLENPYSLTVIPVLYQNVAENRPVFGQSTDAIHFRNAADSLATRYPNSRYVKALSEEASRRENIMRLGMQLQDAAPVGFLDAELPDITGKKVKISDLKSKVVMVYFWTSEAAQKMFNLDVFIPVYEQYHDKGFEIYAVSLDTDKTVWASSVRNQKLPWVNVCDGLGTASPVAALYNVAKVPASYFIVDGNLDAAPAITDEASLRKYLAKVLK